MHAYLVCGNPESREEKIDALLKKNKLTRLDFPLSKISDVRDLEKFTRLSLSTPTAVVVENFDEASEEAQNAFLKSLEEPQKNLRYILSASNPESLLPTISSRCQIIEAGNTNRDSDKALAKTKKFLKLTPGERLLITSKITNREDAIDLMKEFLLGAHSLLKENPDMVGFISEADKTLKNLEANGNVQLQLTNFVVNL